MRAKLQPKLDSRRSIHPTYPTREDVRRHVQRMRYPWRDGIITLRGGQSTLSERRVVVTMNQVMNDTGMVCILFPQLFEGSGCLELLRQARVIGRGITDSEDREGVEGLDLEIVRILVAQLVHRFFVGDHTVARADWSVTRLSNRACVRTVRRIVIHIERRDESPLSVRSGVHGHCFFNCRLTGAHLIGSGRCPNRMPPCHGNSPLSHRAFRVALGYRTENTPRLFVKK